MFSHGLRGALATHSSPPYRSAGLIAFSEALSSASGLPALSPPSRDPQALFGTAQMAISHQRGAPGKKAPPKLPSHIARLHSDSDEQHPRGRQGLGRFGYVPVLRGFGGLGEPCQPILSP